MAKNRIEKKVDSLLFVLANKPWSALFLIAVVAAIAAVTFTLGVVIGRAGG